MAESKNWLLLRGLARGTGHWGSFAQRLQQEFPQDRFEMIDLPGNGARNLEESPLQIEDYVRDLRANCDYVRSGKNFQILSLSLGAMITVEWMRQHPGEIHKAWIVCTSSSGLSRFYERFRLGNLSRGLRFLGQDRNDTQWEEMVLAMITNSPERRKAEAPALTEYSQRYPVKTRNVLRQMVAASRYRFPAQAPGPITLIGTHGDRLVSPRCTLKIAETWGQQALMHPWSGHDLPIDDPQWLLEQLRTTRAN